DRRDRWANEYQAVLFTLFGKLSVFRQKTISWVNCLSAAFQSNLNDAIAIEVAGLGGGAAQVPGFICLLHKTGMLICIGIHRDALNAHTLGCTDDTVRNFATVGD